MKNGVILDLLGRKNAYENGEIVKVKGNKIRFTKNADWTYIVFIEWEDSTTTTLNAKGVKTALNRNFIKNALGITYSVNWVEY